MALIFSRRSSSLRFASRGRVFLRPIRSERISGLAHRRMSVPDSRMTLMFSSRFSAPPPSETILGFSSLAISAMTADSISRNFASPSCSKISLMLLPARSTITASVSTNGRPRRSAMALPVRLLPLAIKPVKKICCLILALHPFAHDRREFRILFACGFGGEPLAETFDALVYEHSLAGDYLAALRLRHLQ